MVVSRETVNDFLDKNGPHLAAAISFYALFSLFPLVLAFVSALGYFLGSRFLEPQFARDIADQVPVSSTFISNTLEGLVNARTVTGVASIVGLLLASTPVFGAIRKGVNAAWGIKQPRPFLQERLIDFLLVVGAGLLLVMSIFATTLLSFVEEITRLLSPEATVNGDFILSLGGSFILALLTFLTFLVLYRYLPNTRVTFREVWPGALLAAVAFEVAKNVFVWYVGTYPSYNVIYGSVGAIVALLAWVYLSALILLFGALLTSRHATYLSARAEEAGSQVWNGLRTKPRTPVASGRNN